MIKQSSGYIFKGIKNRILKRYMVLCSLQHFVFTIVKIWKHPKCPSMEDKMWYIENISKVAQ